MDKTTKIVILILGIVLLIGGAMMFVNKENLGETITPEEVLTQEDSEYVVYFYSSTCGYCQELNPTLSSMLEKEQVPYPFYNIEVSNYQNLFHPSGTKPDAKWMNENEIAIAGTPTLMYIKDGKVIEDFIGSGEILNFLSTKDPEVGKDPVEQKLPYENISASELDSFMNLNDSFTLIDVRRSDEVSQGVIPGATWIEDIQITSGTTLPENKKVVIYCNSGNRSVDVSNYLAEKGYTVYNVTGGIQEYMASGGQTVPLEN